ncbi:sensor histidine kinase [Pedobacter gandavensis]|uniref:sensor histidine kinase n=1 Tax=Pedobacter gandavensis TaxID=2679963 RepID=UPI00292FF4AA|nr:sensor histidine kinase [Pedobacter gandavensis]
MEKTEELNFLNILLPFAGLMFMICLGVIFIARRYHQNLYKQQLKQENLKLQYQKELLLSTFNAQEKERKRIASDLHDELGAALSISRMQLIQLERQSKVEAPDISAALLSIHTITGTALNSVRRICHELMPVNLESFGLMVCLESLVTQFNKSGIIKLKLENGQEDLRLPAAIELHLYRIIMELINNTLKHAEATAIELCFELKNDYIRVHYADNGKGLAPEIQKKKQGLGADTITARINALNGTYNFFSPAEKGMAVEMKIPNTTDF